MAMTDNFKLNVPNYNEYADIKVLNENFKTIDKGLTLDVGNSTGTGNNYILDIGNITLTFNNKGISFKFFADKDSDTSNTVKIVINGTSYNLLKSNKNSVRNLKNGVPYIITYDGGRNFFLASGGNEVSDETNITSDKVLADTSFVGQNGEIQQGGIPVNGALNYLLPINGTYSIPMGYTTGGKVTQNITTKGNQTYIPSTSNQIITANQYLTGNQTILGDSNLVASNIRENVNMFGITGTCTIQSLGGLKLESGIAVTVNEAESGSAYGDVYININTTFTPKLVIMAPNFDYNRCQFLFITNLFDSTKIYTQKWQGTSSDLSKRQIGTSIADYDASMMKHICLGKTLGYSEKSVPWYAFG